MGWELRSGTLGAAHGSRTEQTHQSRHDLWGDSLQPSFSVKRFRPAFPDSAQVWSSVSPIMASKS